MQQPFIRRKPMQKASADLKHRSVWMLYLFLAPALILTFLFAYLPMFSNVIAFMDYRFSDGWMGLGSPFVGFKHFQFLTESWFWQLAFRTVYYSAVLIAVGFLPPLVLALLFNELQSLRFKKFVQTVSYIPHFVSWVTIAGLFYLFLSNDVTGVVNNVKVALFGGERISYMMHEAYFLPILVISSLWKELGWGTIIYLAAITNVDTQLYEAARMDGANRFQQVRHVTLPALVPTISILLIFSLGGLFSTNFDQVFNLQNQVLREVTDTINIFTFYKGIRARQYSMSTAVGLFQGVVSFLLVMVTNRITKKLSDTAII